MIRRFNTIRSTSVKTGGAIALALVALIVSSCDTSGPVEETQVEAPPVTGEDTPEAEEAPSEDIEDIAEEPTYAIGDTVTLQGQVEDSYGTNAFRLQQEEDFFGEDSLLVVSASPLSPLPADEEYVEVTGTVREFAIAEFEREYGYDFDEEVEAELEIYETKPVVVAESVELVEGS